MPEYTEADLEQNKVINGLKERVSVLEALSKAKRPAENGEPYEVRVRKLEADLARLAPLVKIVDRVDDLARLLGIRF